MLKVSEVYQRFLKETKDMDELERSDWIKNKGAQIEVAENTFSSTSRQNFITIFTIIISSIIVLLTNELSNEFQQTAGIYQAKIVNFQHFSMQLPLLYFLILIPLLIGFYFINRWQREQANKAIVERHALNWLKETLVKESVKH